MQSNKNFLLFREITLKRETNISWGRAIAGYALLGVAGSVVGSVTGEDRNVNACLDCGTAWKAADLYKILGIIENHTRIKLNLELRDDRDFMNNFIEGVVPHLEKLEQARKRSETVMNISNKDRNEFWKNIGVAGGCLSGIILTAISAVLSITVGFAPVIICCAIGWAAGTLMDRIDKKRKGNDYFMKHDREKSEAFLTKAELAFEDALRVFLSQYPREA